MITKITMTHKQVHEIEGIDIFSNEWYERMSDITGCPPDFLRTRIPDPSFIDYVNKRTGEVKARRGWKSNKSVGNLPLLWIVVPVSQDESGELTCIETGERL